MTRPLTLALLLLPLWAGAQIREDAPLPIEAASIVKYGAGAKWTAKLLQKGAYKCSNAVFGDPNYGVVKACYVYPVNRYACGIESGVGTDASYGTSGAWLSHWCPLAGGGYSLHIVAGKWADAAPGVVCYLKASGSSLERLAACAPGDVTSAAISPAWAGDALRIVSTKP